MRSYSGKHAELTDKIIAAFYTVYKELGYGFLEAIYKKAMQIELENLGLKVEPEKELVVYFRQRAIGVYRVDMIVNDLVIIELKATKQLLEEHEAQLLNYLKASPIEVGLLMNFGPEPSIRRKVYDNDRKGSLLWTKL